MSSVDLTTTTATTTPAYAQQKPTGAGRPIACKRCNTHITSSRYLVSRAYRGYRGKAALYSSVSKRTTVLGPPTVQLMQTGATTVRALTCTVCNAYLGWEIARAHEESEAWKGGHAVLELSCVGDQEDRELLDDELRGDALVVEAQREREREEQERAPTPVHHHRRDLSSSSVWRKTVVKFSAASRFSHLHTPSKMEDAEWEIS